MLRLVSHVLPEGALNGCDFFFGYLSHWMGPLSIYSWAA